MIARRSLRSAAVAVALLFAVSACSDDDGEERDTLPEAVDPASDCAERLKDLLTDDDVVAAAQAGTEVPDEVEDRFDDLDDDCNEELETLPEAELQAILEDVDPAVLQMMREPVEQDFEITGDSIG